MGDKTLPDDLLDSAETVSVETQKVSSSPKADPYHPGQVIGGKYRLVRRLGEGGMASVWVAHNELLDIDIAIKFIRAELQSAGLADRLLQEARAAARLGHPAIVRVSDFGNTAEGDPYIVMELLNGEDLGAVVKRKGPLQPLKAVRTLLPIADALAVAHAKGIVHRDLKPENIFLAQTTGGKLQPKLVDFGIAKLEREDSQRITQMGAAMGSPAYMSPEQARGLDVDARTDVWALCVVLYELLTGQLPFTGNTYTALVVAILEGKPKPITELGIGDDDLWQVIARGLEKEPDRRWPSMRDVGAALARWALAQSVTDDITGTNLHSSWLDRAPDSSGGARSVVAIEPTLPAVAPVSATSNAGHGMTQLSATISGGPTPRKRSTFIVFAAAAVIVLGIAVGVALRAWGNASAAPEPAAPAPPTASVAVEPAVKPAAPKVEPTSEPAPSAEPTTAEAPAPGPTGKRPVVRPAVSKPAVKPPASAAKPPDKPKPPEKDPLDQLKTF
jgi:serine/threonine-protein kinase